MYDLDDFLKCQMHSLKYVILDVLTLDVLDKGH